MARYIDADALVAELQKKPIHDGHFIHTRDVSDAIFYAPTLSPDEVRGVGEWIPLNYSDEFYGDMYQCSNCGGATIGEPDYCECCGARMKGAEDGTTDNS